MFAPVAHPQVHRSIRLLYLGAGVLFLTTVALGILNVFSGDTISRGQILAHFHSGSIGWVTLTVIATTIWVMTGQRQVSERYASFTLLLAGVGLVAVAGYVAAFGLAFHRNTDYWMLPLFGIPAGLTIMSAFVFAVRECRRQAVLTNAHLLLTGALGVASLGATMGIFVGLLYSTGIRLFPAGTEVVGAHAGPMDMYLALAFTGIVELFLGQEGRWTRPGMAQMVLGVASGVGAWAALYFDVGPAIPLALLLFLLSFLFYMGRIGWRTFRASVLTSRPGLFFGGIGIVAYFLLFIYVVMAYFSRGAEPPHVLEVIFLHTTFVGMATNLAFTVHRRFGESVHAFPGLVSMGIWTMNAGLLAFFLGERVAGARHGALLMAVGVLMAWAAVMRRTAGTVVAPAAA